MFQTAETGIICIQYTLLLLRGGGGGGGFTFILLATTERKTSIAKHTTFFTGYRMWNETFAGLPGTVQLVVMGLPRHLSSSVCRHFPQKWEPTLSVNFLDMRQTKDLGGGVDVTENIS